ncbi:MAG: TonB-dependent receptor [Rhodoferax sp.]
MNLKVKRLTLAIGHALPWLCAAPLAKAQNQEAAAQLAPVVVTAPSARPLPLGQTLVPDAAAHIRWPDTASVLTQVPGVNLNAGGALSGLPAMNGLADDRLRLRVDGMDLIASCPNHMNPALSYIAPSQVGQITVLPGVTPVSFGGDSIGGSILVEPAPLRYAPAGSAPQASGQLGASVRSNNNARTVDLGASYATERVALDYSGALARADDYHAAEDFKTYDFTGRVGHTLGRDVVGSTAYDARNHALRLGTRWDTQQLQLRLGWQDMPEQGYPNQRMDMLDNQQRSVSLRYTGTFDWGVLSAQIYHETVDHFMDFGADKRYWYGNGAPPTGSGGSSALNGSPCSPISSTCAAGMPMKTEGRTDGARVQADVNLAQDQVLTLGSELQRYRVDDYWLPSGAGMAPGTFWNIRDGRRDRDALFAQWQAKPSADWSTLLGLRWERVAMDAGAAAGYNPATNGMGTMMNYQKRDADAFNAQSHARTDHNLDLSALARWRASAQTDAEFGLARKVRSPNVYERFTWSTWQMAALMNNFVGDGNGYVGNLALKPEVAHTLSARVNWHSASGDTRISVAPFYTEVQNYIDAVQWSASTNAPVAQPVVGRFSVLKYVNQSARLAGFTLSGQWARARNDWGDWGLRGQISHTRGVNRDTGQALYGIMPLNARITLTHAVGAWDNALEWVLVSAKTQVNLMRNEIPTAGYGRSTRA